MKYPLILSTFFFAFAPLTADAKPPKKSRKAKKHQQQNINNYRPQQNGLTFGMGVGMSVPSNQLDNFVYRLRFNRDVMLEPMLNMGKSSSELRTITTTDVTTGETSTQIESAESQWFGGGLALRYRMAKHGNTDFQAIGGLNYLKTETTGTIQGISGSSLNSEAALSANLGLGLESFFANKWSAGFDVTTPIYTQSNTTYRPIDTSLEPRRKTETTSNQFDPTFKIVLTHYF
jgi:hypothetical protein